MITYNQYPQLGVRQRPLVVTCLWWRDFLRKEDLLYQDPPDVITDTWDHLSSPDAVWAPTTRNSLCFSSFFALMLPALLILFYLKRWAHFQVIWISFHILLKEIKFNRLDDVSLRDGAVGSIKIVLFILFILVYVLMKTQIVATRASAYFMKWVQFMGRSNNSPNLQVAVIL